MNTATSRNTACSRKTLLAIAVLLISACAFLTYGMTSAYADETNQQNASSTAQSNNQSASPASETPGGFSGVQGLSSQDNPTTAISPTSVTNPTSTANPPQEGSSLSPSSNNLGAADNTYPGDDGSDPIFVGLNSNGYRVTNTNEVIVDINTQVGESVVLSADIEYIRIGKAVYDSRSTANVEATWSTQTYGATTVSTSSDDLMVSWYEDTMAPLPQGVYYASFNNQDPGFGGSPGIDSDTVHYNVNPQAFVHTFATRYNPLGRFDQSYFPVSDYDNRYSLNLPTLASVSAMSGWGLSNGHRLYYEHEGDYFYSAQFTFVQEISEMAGGVEYISYRIAASNPVMFFVHVAPRALAEVSFEFQDDSGNPVEIGNGNFKLRFDRTVQDQYHYDGYYVTLIPRGYYTEQSVSYQYASPGDYIIEIEHRNGCYEKYSSSFSLSQAEFDTVIAGDGKITWLVTLKKLAPETYTVTFFAEDGTTILQVEDLDASDSVILVDSKEYNEGTLYDAITKPKTIPVKPEDDDYVYVFNGWSKRGSSTITGVTDVTGDTDYIAVYRGISKHVEPTVQKVYATGGLLGKKPDSVLAYEFDYRELSDDQKNGIMESYAPDIDGKGVVAIFEVNLTQHNRDGSSTSVSEGVGDLNLSFDVGAAPGITEGAKVQVIQIHTDSSNQIQKFFHRGLVVSEGKVNVTLNDKLSTFIITTDEDYVDPNAPTDPTETNPSDTPTQGGDTPTPGDEPTTEPSTPTPGGTPSEEPTSQPTTEPSDTPAAEPVGPTPAENTPNEPESTPEASPAENPANLQDAVSTGAENLANAISNALPAAGASTDQPMVKTGETPEDSTSKPSETGDSQNLQALGFGACLALALAIALSRRRQEM